MGIKDQFQDKANELKDQAHNKAMSDSREQGHERQRQDQDQERGGQRPEREGDRRQGGQQPRDRGQQGRRPAQDSMDAAEGRFQS
ncbi:hypothetical protein [Streptomyces tubercidicus]